MVPVWPPCEHANGVGGREAKEEGEVTTSMRRPWQDSEKQPRDPGVRLGEGQQWETNTECGQTREGRGVFSQVLLT